MSGGFSRLVIRGAQTDEHDEIAHVWLESSKSTGFSHLMPRSWDELRRRIPRELADGLSLYVAETQGEIAGFVAFRRRDNYLHLLFVAPDRQGRGVGQALLSFTKTQLRDEIWLRAASADPRVCAWYEREGFVFEKEAPHETAGMMLRYYRWKRG